MKAFRYCLSVLFIASILSSVSQQIQSAQAPVVASAPAQYASELRKKIRSGDVLVHLSQKKDDALMRGVTPANSYITAVIYASACPSAAFVSALEALGVRAVAASWIPPLEHHPLGFFIAQVPIDRFDDVLALADVKMMDSAEREAIPLNNLAAAAIKANLAWANNWTGTGVRVGILDSGYDDRMPAAELPSPVAKMDYSQYPTSIDTTVRNTVSPHGTHVVGIVLGRGGWSSSNTINGGGSYKGMAPNADLVFLKIGDDQTAGASTAAIVGAMKAAVDSFSVKVISMSYGGWDVYHDGSDPMCQAVDYAYSKGAACFLAAGNSAAEGHHVSGSVKAHDTSGYFQITVTGAAKNTAFLEMNLVWADGAARNGLSLLYYSSSMSPLTSVVSLPQTTSDRGTESQISYYNYYMPTGNSTYYVRVLNASASAQPFHIFFYVLFSNVLFALSDPNYTIGNPACADHAFAVGASTSRLAWTASNGVPYTTSGTLSDIANFSSRGPRIDGLPKPNITAPGKIVISLRDRDVLKTSDAYWIDNDGVSGGPANYYVMQGTSMATPLCSGAAALVYQHTPRATPQQVYDAFMLSAANDAFTGLVPNSTWGYGRLDVNGAINNTPLPVELAAFTASSKNDIVTLWWKTASEVDNYGFEIEKKPVVHAVGSTVQRDGVLSAWTTIGFAAGNGTSNAPHVYSYVDRLQSPGAYAYRLKQIDRDGKYSYSAEIKSSPGASPAEYWLGQNYPNPFNPVTHVQFSIGTDETVHIAVFDILGRTVAELVNEPLHAGRYTVEWNGSEAASGMYVYRINAGSFSAVKKLLLQK
jgi:subtilisin family serine protease